MRVRVVAVVAAWMSVVNSGEDGGMTEGMTTKPSFWRDWRYEKVAILMVCGLRVR